MTYPWTSVIAGSALAMLVVTSGWCATQAQKVPPVPSRSAPARTADKPVVTPDLAVLSLSIELVSTTKNRLGTEFPTDRLKVTAVVMDVTTVRTTTDFIVTLLRDSTILSTKTMKAPTTAGQTWTFIHEESYLHDRPPTFRVGLRTSPIEKDVTNNDMHLYLDDEALHRDGKLVATDQSGELSTIKVPPGVIVIF